MKLQSERIDGLNAIARHSQAGVIVNGVAYTQHVVVPWNGQLRPWAVSGFDGLDEQSFEQLLDWKPELVIFGSGSRIRFASPRLMAGLMRQRIGVETMDTAAACRTYNVLLTEGRAVLAALLFE